MPHDSCVTIKGQLTYQEEKRLTQWIVTSLASRPNDWVQTEYVCRDNKTGLEVWTAHGRWAVSIWRPVQTEYFRWMFRRRIWSAVHEHRHRVGTSAYQQLTETINAAPLALEPTEVIPPRRIPSFAQRLMFLFFNGPAPMLRIQHQPGMGD